MPYPDHYLASFGGTLRGDVWNCNIRMIADTPLTSSDQEAKAHEVWTAVSTTMLDGSVTIASAASVLTYAKFNRIAADGTYQDPGTTHAWYQNTTPISAPVHANSDALVLSWVTEVARGPGSSGRIYWPCPGLSIGAANGKVSGTSIAANFGAMLINKLNDDAGFFGPDTGCAVVSPLGGGVTHRIIGVRVGDVMDTQRRRRNAFPETYVVNTTAIV